MAIYLISDLHLSDERPHLTRAFLRYLATLPDTCESLYILGDLFEYWVGDDDESTLKQQVSSALKTCADRHIAVFFQHGNRDFLIGADFCNATGIKLLPEYFCVDYNGVRYLLMHGDLLCTRDEDYMAFRKMVRTPAWQREFLSHPLQERHTIAAQLRSDSKTASSNKPDNIMDVTPDEVTKSLLQYQSDYLLHGHTHRPAVHTLPAPHQHKKRIVLGDWGEQGWQIILNGKEPLLESFPLQDTSA